jgi:DNA-binding transcriptional LysR family regulator
VFRRLNALEAGLGVRLFERLPSGYQLSPAGQRVLEFSRQADATLQRIELELAGQDFSPEGRVSITTASNIARTLLPPVLKQLRQSHPGIQVEVSVGDADYDLNRREADIALRATLRPPDHLIGKRLITLAWWMHGAVGKGGDAPQALEDFRGQPLIGTDATLMRLPAFQWLESEFQADIVTRANDLSTMAAFAGAGIGYALLPSDQDERGLRRLWQVPDLSGELWLLTHPDLRQVARIRVVWDALVAGLAAGN